MIGTYGIPDPMNRLGVSIFEIELWVTQGKSMTVRTLLFRMLLCVGAFTVLTAVTEIGQAMPARIGTTAGREPNTTLQVQSESFLARVETVNYKGWNAYRLSNNLVTLIVVPDIGGRAIQLQIGKKELFFVNSAFAGKVLPESENNPKAGFANYGGDKLWPAPEGWLSDQEWPSIPYFVLDGSRYQAEIVANTSQEVALRVTSPGDPRTGIQFARTYHVYAGITRVRVDEVMRNVSRRQIRWGMWHLVQHDAADINDPSKPNPDFYMFVPLNPHSRYPEGYNHMYGDARHPSYDVVADGKMLRAHYLYRVGKIGVDSNRGWYAVVNGQKQTCFVETFKYFAEEEYPDNASVEAWNDGPGIIHRDPFDQILKNDSKETPYFFESEIMSPFITLSPGEEHLFTVEWAVTNLPPIVVDSKWIGVVSEPLRATASGNSVLLTGVFGVYSPGTLEAIFYDEHGVVLLQRKLLDVDPRATVKLNQNVELPPGTFRISICVRAADGENLGFLGNAMLP